MTRRGRKFGPLLYVTLSVTGLALVAVPTWPRAVEQCTAWTLCRRLRDANEGVRREAAEGLARLGPPASTWVIRSSKDPAVQARVAACSIVRILDPDRPRAAVAALIDATGDDELPVRLVAVEQLKDAVSNPAVKGAPRLRDRAIGALRAALGDHAPEVRVAAAWGLLQVDPGGSSRMVTSAMKAIAAERPDANPHEYWSALRILKDTIGTDGVAAMLIESLGVPARKRDALYHLTTLCPEAGATEPFLVGLLKDADAGVRCEAALFLLGRDPGVAAPALDVLMGQLADPPDGAYFPADLVGMIRDRSPASLARVTRSMIVAIPHSEGRRFPGAAIDALGAIGPGAKPAVPALLAVADSDDRRLSMAAIAALVKIDPPSAATKLPLLIDRAGLGGETGERLAALATLRDLGPEAKAAAPALVPMADEDDIRISAAAIEALSRVDPTRAAEIKRAARD